MAASKPRRKGTGRKERHTHRRKQAQAHIDVDLDFDPRTDHHEATHRQAHFHRPQGGQAETDRQTDRQSREAASDTIHSFTHSFIHRLILVDLVDAIGTITGVDSQQQQQQRQPQARSKRTRWRSLRHALAAQVRYRESAPTAQEEQIQQTAAIAPSIPTGTQKNHRTIAIRSTQAGR